MELCRYHVVVTWQPSIANLAATTRQSPVLVIPCFVEFPPSQLCFAQSATHVAHVTHVGELRCPASCTVCASCRRVQPAIQRTAIHSTHKRALIELAGRPLNEYVCRKPSAYAYLCISVERQILAWPHDCDLTCFIYQESSPQPRHCAGSLAQPNPPTSSTPCDGMSFAIMLPRTLGSAALIQGSAGHL